MNNTLLGVVAFSLSLAPLAAQANPAPSASAHVAISVTGARPVAVRPAPLAPVVVTRPQAPGVRTVAVVRPPPPALRAGGRYEWQTQNQLIPAHREVVRIQGKHHKHKKEVRWVPAHYEPVGQWVWVAYTVPAPRPPVRVYPAHR